MSTHNDSTVVNCLIRPNRHVAANFSKILVNFSDHRLFKFIVIIEINIKTMSFRSYSPNIRLRIDKSELILYSKLGLVPT